ERDALLKIALVPDLRWVDIAVEYHPPSAVRVLRRIDLSQVGAVGEAVVVQLLGAEGRTDPVHVAHRVDRLHVLQQLRRLGRTGLGVDLGTRQPLGLDTVRLGNILRSVVALVVTDTVQSWLARAHTAGVETDPVVVLPRLLRHRAFDQRQPQSRSPRTTRVDQHDALFGAGGFGPLNLRDP